MKISVVEAGMFKLDGGAMFGVVPKRIWNRMNPADQDNLCTWTMRSILIEVDDRKILVDTGIGFKQGERFRSHFYPHGQELEESLTEQGFASEEITDVFITHFHFDHVGGALCHNRHGRIIPTFPNATYWSNERHYNYASDPNPREVSSFLKENFVPLKEQGCLQFIDCQSDDVPWLSGLKVRFVDGHTDAQMLLLIDQGMQKYLYAADLIPSKWHIRLPYIMAYDMQPALTLMEKERVLTECVAEDRLLIFEHDPTTEVGKIAQTDEGRFQLETKGLLSSSFPTS
ncbi:MAG: MBL fold metallo-hydrolase [Saprospiraceae bacterium]|nr:MBL fold metallo-hydrolase [Saprospiraceae bacterium]